MTGLHWACKKGYEKIADFLIENHSDLEATDLLLRTPVDFASKLENKHIVHNILKLIQKHSLRKKLQKFADLLKLPEDRTQS